MHIVNFLWKGVETKFVYMNLRFLLFILTDVDSGLIDFEVWIPHYCLSLWMNGESTPAITD